MRESLPKTNSPGPLSSLSPTLTEGKHFGLLRFLTGFIGSKSKKIKSLSLDFLSSYLFKLCLILVLGMGSVGEVMGQCGETEDEAGTYSFTVPAGVTQITVEAWGAGGRGGTRTSNGTGGGGGGGGYSSRTFTVIPGTTYNYSVGSGGNNSSIHGGNTTFTAGANSVVANGGRGVDDNIATGGAGGTLGTGTVRYTGGRGANGGSDGGGGGSSAGTGQNGNYTNSTTNSNGANAPAGGGNGGDGADNNNEGDDGISPGGGGGGGKIYTYYILWFIPVTVTRDPGDGADGQIRISYSSTITAGSPSASVPACVGAAMTPITRTTTGVTGIGTYSGLPAGVTPSLSGNTLTISGTPTNQATGNPVNYSITLTGACGASTVVTGTTTVNPSPTPPFTAQPSTSIPYCIGDEVIYTTQSGMSDYTWDILGVSGTDYQVVSGAGTNSITVRWLTPGSKAVTINYTNLNGCRAASAASSNSITISTNPSATPATATTCAATSNANIISQPTEGVTSIGTPTGLPTGVTASFSGDIITISGTPTVTPGDYSYSIPLNNATCSLTGTATGTITVENCACEDDPITSPGPGQITIPTGVTSITVEAWGGGGRGGSKTSNNGTGGGGGGGAYSRSVILVNPGDTYHYSVGQGSPASTVTTPPSGGDSWFSENSNGSSPSVLAKGGNSVNNRTSNGNSNGANGGQASAGVGDQKFDGGNGANGSNGDNIPDTNRVGGGGGSSAGTSSNGNNATGINGAGAPIGGGDGGNGRNGNGVGYPGSSPGGGGGGAERTSGSRDGGAGGDGQIKITYNLSAGTLSGYPYVCVGQTTPYQSDLPGGGGIWSSSNNAVATVNSAGVVTGVAAGSATIFYTVYGSCAIAQTSRAVFVQAPIDPGTLAGNQEICIGGTSTFTSNTTNGTWTSDNPGIATVHSTTGLVTGIAAGTATISYTPPVSGLCTPIPATRTITVTPPPSAGTLSGDQAVCVGGTSTFSSTVPGGTWTSSNLGIATIDPATGAITGVGAGIATMTYTVTGTGGCTDVSTTRDITVTAAPSAGTLSGNQEVCVGETPTFGSSVPGGIWSSSDPGIATIAPSTGLVTAVSAGTATMTYIVSGTGGCADATETRNITVHALPTPTFTDQPASPVCLDEEVTYSTEPDMDFYFWVLPGDVGTDYEIISGGTETDHSVTLVWKSIGSKSVGINYQDTNGCPSPAIVYSNTITVDPNISIDSESLGGQIICDGGSFSQISVTASGPGTFHYQWYKNTSNTTSGGTPVGTDSDSYLPLQSDFAAIGDGNPLYYYVEVSQVDGCGAPVTSSISGAFVVKELVQITGQPDTTGGVQCYGDGFGPISVSATGSDLTYQWYSNTDPENTDGTLIPGATSANFTPPSTTPLNVIYYYYAVVTGYCLPGVPSDLSGSYIVTPPNTTITVDLDPNAGDEVRCIGDSTSPFSTLTVEATGEIDDLPAVNYQWYRNDTPENTEGTAISGETNPTFTPEADVAGTWYYYATASSDCGTVPTSISQAFVVNPETAIDDESLDSQTICEGDDFDPISVEANSGFPDYQASLSYQWYSNTDSSYTGPGLTAISGANTASFTPPADVPGSTLYYFVVVSGGCGPDVPSTISGAHYVTPNPTVGPASSDPEVCIDQAIPAITHTTTSAISIGTAFNLPDGVTASIDEVTQTLTLSGTPTESGTFSYTIPVLGCDGSSVDATGTITVNPEAEIVDLTATICSGEAFNLTPADGTDGEIPAGTTYTWTVADNPNVTGDSDQTVSQTSISQTLSHTEPTAETVVYTVTPSTPAGCIGDTFTVTVTVNPKPEISPISETICGSDSGPFTVSPVDGIDGIVPSNTTYTWVVAANGNVTGESNQTTPQPAISQTLTNAGTTIETVTYTVTPTSGNCPGNPFTITVTVNPTPTVEDPADQEICNNSNTTAVNFTGNAVAGVVYNWTNDTPSIGLAASGTGDIPAFTATNSTENDVTATITVTPSANGCDGPAETFTITVNPSPIQSLIPDYCAPGGEVGLIATENKPGTTWLWSTGETTSSISVKIAGNYSVTATTTDGCVETKSIAIAQELVINGDFTDGNTVDPAGITGFNTGYSYTADVAGDSELVPEGRYGIGPDARTYHNNFWGSDHTNNTVGPRNMMIVNGYPGSNSTIIWEQEVTVRPGVDYYFSAYAMSLNNVSPYAKLQFEVNGEQVGTVANLSAGVNNNSNSGWEEFYGIWPSTVDGTIKIRIINLEPSPGGNDFALDDLSFGTLSTFVTLTSANDTDDQTVCQDSPISDITYSVGTGIAGPVVTNLPPGVTTTWNGVTLRFTGSPTTPGDYTYTVTTTGVCSPATTTGRIIVHDTPTEGTIASDQTVCAGEDPATILGDVYAPQEAGATISYRWEMNTDLSTPNWVDVPGNPPGADYDPPLLTETTQYRRTTVSTVGTKSCPGPPSEPVTITVQSEPTAGEISGAQTICEGDDPDPFTSTTDGTGDGDIISYIWQFRNSTTDPDWTTISGATDATYDSPALSETTQFQRITVSSLNGIDCFSDPTNTVTVTVNPENTVEPEDPDPTLCLNEASPIIITHTTTGVTGIVPQSASVNYNLPNGVTPSWNAGVLTIQGTPTEMGVFNYNIPLSGGCGPTSATGTVTVTNPAYPIINIEVENPSSVPGSSTFTVYSPGMTPGYYWIEYSTNGVNGGASLEQITVEVTTSGEFTFTLPTYFNEGTTILTINSIQEITDLCPYYPPNNNTAPYGVGCSTVFLQSDGDDAFYVPAGVSEVRIEAFGDGSPLESQTIPVLPGGVINVGVVGNEIFATQAPVASVTPSDYIVSATGPDGQIVFHFECDPPEPDCPGLAPYEYIDAEGFTVLRFDVGACEWHAPDGLDEFEILIVGGGGGGGFGNAAGGGGGGAVVYQHYTDITMNGLPGLQDAVFPLSVGTNGAGATTVASRGGNGQESSISGPAFASAEGTFSGFTAAGGGGGGSTSSDASVREGVPGASGGGGAAYGTEQSPGGSGSAGSSGGNAYGQTSGTGGGGGGGAAGAGEDAIFGGTMTAGSGGSGVTRGISGDDIFYGAGGGGTSSGAVTNQAGTGGSPYGSGYFAGGSGTNHGVGQSPTTYGSGGGAGRDGGGAGFPGVIYIRYPNYRILPVEYLYFKAEYNANLRSGDLTWATSREWENDRFEIERSVNNVKEWEKIGEVAGAGSSDSTVEYFYRDSELPLAGGDIFYRLKQVDFDGDFTYSDIKAIRLEAMEGISHWRVYPNPTTGYPFEIELLDNGAYRDEQVTLRVIAATGQFETFQVKDIHMMGSMVSEWFRTKAAGIYTLEITWGENIEYHKVILKR